MSEPREPFDTQGPGPDRADSPEGVDAHGSGAAGGKMEQYAEFLKGLTAFCVALASLGGVLVGVLKVFGGDVPGLRADLLLVGLAGAELAAAVVLIWHLPRRGRVGDWWVLVPAAGPLLLLVDVFQAPGKTPTWWSNGLAVLAFAAVFGWAAAKVFGGADLARSHHSLCKVIAVVAGANILISGMATASLLSNSNGQATSTQTATGMSGVLATTVISTTTGTAPPPRPSVAVSKAWSKTIPACSSPECAYVAVSFANFPPGMHKVTCYSDYPSPGPFESYTTSLQTSYDCVYGYPGGHVWAYVDEIPSDRYTW